MKKRIIVTLFIAAALALSACGGSSSESAEAEDAQSMSTEEKADSLSASAEDDEEDSTETEADDSDFSQIIVDEDNIKFEITEIEHDNFWGYAWKVSLENNTDETLVFTIDDVSVNGVMSNPYWAETVTAGHKANSEISWMSSDFEENDIEKVTEVSFELRVYDDDTFDDYFEETFTVYPYGEENAQNDSREISDSDLILFDNDLCSMRVTGVDPDDLWGYALKVTLVNKTDTNLMFSTANVSIDGVMCNPYWASEVAAGKSSNEEISWMTSTLEDAGITDMDAIESIELPITVYDSDDYSGDYYVDETFTVNVRDIE